VFFLKNVAMLGVLVIFANHVMGNGHEAKFWLEPKIELAKNKGFSETELNEIYKIIKKNEKRFREQYQQHIGKRIDD
jgi:hypothetical protein